MGTVASARSLRRVVLAARRGTAMSDPTAIGPPAEGSGGPSPRASTARDRRARPLLRTTLGDVLRRVPRGAGPAPGRPGPGAEGLQSQPFPGVNPRDEG